MKYQIVVITMYLESAESYKKKIAWGIQIQNHKNKTVESKTRTSELLKKKTCRKCYK